MEQIEALVCQCGCGRKLLTKNGAPDFKKRVFDKSCQLRIKRLKKRISDAKLRTKAASFQRRLTTEMARTMKKIEAQSKVDVEARTTPLWLTVRGRRTRLVTLAGALALAKQFPEILDQVKVEPVLPARRCSASRRSGESSRPPISPSPKTRAASASSGRR